jgi:hypothetical protein
MSQSIERELESRMVTYLKTFSELSVFQIVPAHNTDERPLTYISFMAKAIGGGLCYAGIEEIDATALVVTRADDEAITIHDTAVRTLRAILSRPQMETVKTALNDSSFSLSSIAYMGSDEARDSEKNLHGTSMKFSAVAALL